MTAPECERRSGRSQAWYLEKVLECKSLQEMLRGRAGAFSSRYWFINEYTNYVNLLVSNPYMSSSANLRERCIDQKYIYNTIKNAAQFAEVIFSKKDRSPVDILFISRNRRVRVKTKSGYVDGDYIFYSVISELQRKNPNLVLDMYLIDDDYSKYRYATPLGLLRSCQWALKMIWEWSQHGKEVIDYFQKHGCGFAAQFCGSYFRFRPLFRNALLGYSIKNLFADHRPSVTVSNDDCMYTKPLDSEKTKFLILQSARMVESAEECRSRVFQEPGLLPDYFLASGMIFSQIKERWHIAKNVAVTGLPRYDILFHAHEVYSRHEFLERYSLNPSHKIVYWSTQCHVLSQAENASNFRAVLGAMKQLEDASLVIKQHPAEPEKYTEEIISQIKSYGISAVITAKNSDTYEQLFVCDLMITRHSTTAMEAVALSKPVIILNLSGETDPVEYVKEGVALGVYREPDLLAALKRLLKDDSELAARRDRYIEKYLYKIDGKATQRVIEIIVKSLHDESKTQ